MRRRSWSESSGVAGRRSGGRSSTSPSARFSTSPRCSGSCWTGSTARCPRWSPPAGMSIPSRSAAGPSQRPGRAVRAAGAGAAALRGGRLACRVRQRSRRARTRLATASSSRRGQISSTTLRAARAVGAAVVVRPDELTADAVRLALRRVLDEPSFAGGGAVRAGRDPGDADRRGGRIAVRGVRRSRLGWPRVPACAHSPDRRGARRRSQPSSWPAPR